MMDGLMRECSSASGTLEPVLLKPEPEPAADHPPANTSVPERENITIREPCGIPSQLLTRLTVLEGAVDRLIKGQELLRRCLVSTEQKLDRLLVLSRGNQITSDPNIRKLLPAFSQAELKALDRKLDDPKFFQAMGDFFDGFVADSGVSLVRGMLEAIMTKAVARTLSYTGRCSQMRFDRTNFRTLIIMQVRKRPMLKLTEEQAVKTMTRWFNYVKDRRILKNLLPMDTPQSESSDPPSRQPEGVKPEP